MDVGKGREHDCMDAGGRAMQKQLPRSGSFPHIPVGYAGGTTPWMGEVESRLEQRSRATQGAVAESNAGSDSRYEAHHLRWMRLTTALHYLTLTSSLSPLEK